MTMASCYSFTKESLRLPAKVRTRLTDLARAALPGIEQAREERRAHGN